MGYLCVLFRMSIKVAVFVCILLEGVLWDTLFFIILGICYLTRRRLPMRRVVLRLMLFSLQRVLMEVW